jgi:hypothetical protein
VYSKKKSNHCIFIVSVLSKGRGQKSLESETR